jgi:hypothetical protein
MLTGMQPPFDYLADIKEASGLTRNRSLLEEAKRLKQEHLIAMVQGNYGKDYMEQRVGLGVLYSRAGLDARVFLGAFRVLMRLIGTEIIRHFAAAPADGFESFMSLKKIGFLDIGLIVDVLIAARTHDQRAAGRHSRTFDTGASGSRTPADSADHRRDRFDARQTTDR